MKDSTIAIGVVVAIICCLIIFSLIYYVKLRRNKEFDNGQMMSVLVQDSGSSNGNVKVVGAGKKSAAQLEAERRANNFRFRAKRDSLRKSVVTVKGVSPSSPCKNIDQSNDQLLGSNFDVSVMEKVSIVRVHQQEYTDRDLECGNHADDSKEEDVLQDVETDSNA